MRIEFENEALCAIQYMLIITEHDQKQNKKTVVTDHEA